MRAIVKVKDMVATSGESYDTRRRTPYDIGALTNEIPTSMLNKFNKGILDNAQMDTKKRVTDIADSMDELVSDLREIASNKK